MVRLISKILSVLILVFISFVIFTVAAVSLNEGKNYFYPYSDTQFSRFYTPEKFEKIKIGMTKEETIKAIGRPLNIHKEYNNSERLQFDYTNDGKIRKLGKGGVVGDFAWYRSYLIFDKNGKVAVINYGWSYD